MLTPKTFSGVSFWAIDNDKVVTKDRNLNIQNVLQAEKEWCQVPWQKSKKSFVCVSLHCWPWRKWKDKFAHQQWWKIHGIQNRLAELHGSILSSWVVLVRRSFKTCDLSGAVVYNSLHGTMCTTTIDRQDTCWARFVWKDTRPPLFFPTTKWRKNVTVHL